MSERERCISQESLENTGFSYTLSLINGKYKMIILYKLMTSKADEVSEFRKRTK